MDAKGQQLNKILAPVVEQMGYEYIGCDFIIQGHFSLVRVYIDKEGGVGIDDCAEVSHQISGILDVEDLIKTRYNLEVSSPGLDRPLFTVTQFCKAIGQQIKIRTNMPIDGQRKFTGILSTVIDENIVLVINNEEVTIPYITITKANIVYQFK
ncbi:MAG: ribosome maturation factor RimP [Gammaproteobacteria bacterium RIFCSPHIGHO2_12_FULL_35_23]|nr:MAG: ribosome maturation factor RimP [Gammaproteobacteria bacterium RIFCSPHIGHO2_12_FULL_35_23]